MVWLTSSRSHSNRNPNKHKHRTAASRCYENTPRCAAHNNKLKSKAPRLLKVSTHTPLCNVFIYQWARNNIILMRASLSFFLSKGDNETHWPTWTTRKFFGADLIQLARVPDRFWNQEQLRPCTRAIMYYVLYNRECVRVGLCAFRSTWTIAISQSRGEHTRERTHFLTNPHALGLT